MAFRSIHSLVDQIYWAIMHKNQVVPQFFSAGFGGEKLSALERLASSLFMQVSQGQAPAFCQPLTIAWKHVGETREATLREGTFVTPCDADLKSLLPFESHVATVQLLEPKGASGPKRCVVQLAGTGDHGFARRLRLGNRLIQNGIASVILESPFYGSRRPKTQFGAKLLCVSDLLALGRATIDEAIALLHWLLRERSYDQVGICGLSMGGVHSALVACVSSVPMAVVPLLPAHSAEPVFCEGLLSKALAWEALKKEINGSKEEAIARMRAVMMHTDVTRLPRPARPDAAIIVAATDDCYIPKYSVTALSDAWAGCEVRWVKGGHVSSFILHNKTFQEAIHDSFRRL
eukprot:jgi/Mesvir1/2897/Mv13970-RA.1